MDHKSINNLNIIKNEVVSENQDINIIAVTKTFPINVIEPLLKDGHIHYGENKVQEATDKWSNIKTQYKNIKLHMVGKLQSNKVKFILPLFDYIHSLDNHKLAEKISVEQIKKQFKPKIFIQVNIGNEIQKGGIDKKDLKLFYKLCVENYNLDIVGLMCIPPESIDSKIYFQEMLELKKQLGLKELSMGMSNDYIQAVKNGATYIRIGSKIFGERTKKF